MPSNKESKPMRAAGVLADGRDSRRDERLRVDAKVKYKVIRRDSAAGKVPGTDFQPDGRSVNISLSGLAIVTASALKKGDYLKVEMGLPGRPGSVRALAEVMWAKIENGQHISGIRFLILLNQDDETAIRRFVEAHPDRSHS
ncbi:MAG TPA: PilZ domain-containing protein [bacterium]|jgi:hypothetical protein|nr:PilZ domain-containing protein [bacterium]